MPDPFAKITEMDDDTVAIMGDRLEFRASLAKQQAMLDAYLADLPLRPDTRLLEVGCGTGPVAKRIAAEMEVAEIVGLDPSPQLLERARALVEDEKIRFEVGDARAMPFDDAAFDIALFHTSLCHVPGPERALAEAFRVLRPGGWVAVFDSDHISASVAAAPHDPLQVCMEAATEGNVLDPWLIRKLPELLRTAGFAGPRTRSHGYLETDDAEYLLSRTERGADFLVEWGRIGPELGAALKAEAHRRVAEGGFFGFMDYASVTATKPN